MWSRYFSILSNVEVAFWKNLDSHRGLSLRTLWYSLFQDIIILLYLLDNDTSFIILLSSFAELGVTIWKIFKTMKFSRRDDGKFPFIKYGYKDESYQSTTEQFDSQAGKYLTWALIPLLIGYAVSRKEALYNIIRRVVLWVLIVIFFESYFKENNSILSQFWEIAVAPGWVSRIIWSIIVIQIQIIIF